MLTFKGEPITEYHPEELLGKTLIGVMPMVDRDCGIIISHFVAYNHNKEEFLMKTTNGVGIICTRYHFDNGVRVDGVTVWGRFDVPEVATYLKLKHELLVTSCDERTCVF